MAHQSTPVAGSRGAWACVTVRLLLSWLLRAPPAAMANYSTGMLANLNGQQNYFEPPAEAGQPAEAEEAAAEETAESQFPPPDPTGVSVLQKTLLPFDDHPYAQVRSNCGTLAVMLLFE